MLFFILLYYFLYVKFIFDIFPLHAWFLLRPLSVTLLTLLFLLILKVTKKRFIPTFIFLLNIGFFFILILFARLPHKVAVILSIYSSISLILIYFKKIFRAIGIILYTTLFMLALWNGYRLVYTSNPVNTIYNNMFYEYTGDSIDSSEFYDGNSGLALWYDKVYWGFTQTLPIEGRVYYPETEDKLPLIIVVHGNHLAEDFSHYGYDYLLNHLAHSGFITVSIDQNFLNGNWTTLGYGVPWENDTRAYHLLAHIKHLIDESEKNTNSPLYGRIAREQIGLIGHSRGGEAVAIAAAKSEDINISAVMALAPTDRQFKESIYLKDSSYLTIHGTNDGDVKKFKGRAQYNRTEINSNNKHLKVSYYFDGVNHSQFNSDWGLYDTTGLGSIFYGKNSNISKTDQQYITKTLAEHFFRYNLYGDRDRLNYLKNSYLIPGFPKIRSSIEYMDYTYKEMYNFKLGQGENIETNSLEYEYILRPNNRTMEITVQQGGSITLKNKLPQYTQEAISISFASKNMDKQKVSIQLYKSNIIQAEFEIEVDGYIKKSIYKINNFTEDEEFYEPQYNSYTLPYSEEWDRMKIILHKQSTLLMDNISLISYQRRE